MYFLLEIPSIKSVVNNNTHENNESTSGDIGQHPYTSGKSSYREQTILTDKFFSCWWCFLHAIEWSVEEWCSTSSTINLWYGFVYWSRSPKYERNTWVICFLEILIHTSFDFRCISRRIQSLFWSSWDRNGDGWTKINRRKTSSNCKFWSW